MLWSLHSSRWIIQDSPAIKKFSGPVGRRSSDTVCKLQAGFQAKLEALNPLSLGSPKFSLLDLGHVSPSCISWVWPKSVQQAIKLIALPEILICLEHCVSAIEWAKYSPDIAGDHSLVKDKPKTPHQNRYNKIPSLNEHLIGARHCTKTLQSFPHSILMGTQESL